jgi:hypothetical protein
MPELSITRRASDELRLAEAGTARFTRLKRDAVYRRLLAAADALAAACAPDLLADG